MSPIVEASQATRQSARGRRPTEKVTDILRTPSESRIAKATPRRRKAQRKSAPIEVLQPATPPSPVGSSDKDV